MQLYNEDILEFEDWTDLTQIDCFEDYFWTDVTTNFTNCALKLKMGVYMSYLPPHGFAFLKLRKLSDEPTESPKTSEYIIEKSGPNQ